MAITAPNTPKTIVMISVCPKPPLDPDFEDDVDVGTSDVGVDV
jgi:hypothetical protein